MAAVVSVAVGEVASVKVGAALTEAGGVNPNIGDWLRSISSNKTIGVDDDTDDEGNNEEKDDDNDDEEANFA